MNRILKPIKRQLKYWLARGYRPVLGTFTNVRFIGVTGSCGKTTTTSLLAAILAKQGKTIKCSHTNTTESIAETILAVTPRHRFCVTEVAAGLPGLMAKSAKLLKPHIAVVTNIGQNHYTSYRTLEATALDKELLIGMLPPDGTAVLNADDAYVLAMRNRTKARVITYGLSTEAMVRGECVSCAWPATMSLDVCLAGKRLHVQTQLLGEHWAYVVLAAVSAAIAAGVSLECAAEAVEAFSPIPYRMCPYKMPDGVIFISDNWKTPLWSLPAALDFMRKAKAQRKIVVIGSIADTPKSFFRRYRAVIKQTLDIFDKVIFAGEHALTALRARTNQDDKHILAFGAIYQLNIFLRDYLKPGDLVLLKGVEHVDHLQRIILSRTGSIACWREKCGKRRFCDNCRLLSTPAAATDKPKFNAEAL